MTTCKECKAQISTTAASCPQCGAKPKKTSGCTIIVAAFFGLILLSAIIRGCSGNNASTSTPTLPTNPQPTTPTPAKADPATVLAESKKIIEEIEARLKENAEQLKKYYGTPEQVKQATTDMIKLAVVKGMYEKSENKEEKALGTRADSLISRVTQQQRTIYASATEEIFVKTGMDVNVSATGPKKEQMRVKYVLMSKPLVYKFQNELKLPEQARVFGFKKIIYSDGYNETWTVEL